MTDNRNHVWAGIKIKTDPNLPPHAMEIRDAKGNVLERFDFAVPAELRPDWEGPIGGEMIIGVHVDEDGR